MIDTVTTVSVRATGPAAPELVWQRYLDLAAWPGWSPQIAAVETEPGSATELVAGLTGVVRPIVGPGIPFEVLTLDAGVRRWVWRVRMAGVWVVMEHTVGAAGPSAGDGAGLGGPHTGERPGGTHTGERPGGTTAGLVIDGPAPLAYGYAPIARVALGRLIAA